METTVKTISIMINDDQFIYMTDEELNYFFADVLAEAAEIYFTNKWFD